MSSLKQESSSLDTSPATLPFDMDQYINLDSAVAASPSSSSKAFPLGSPNNTVPSSRLQQPPQQQTFSRPSHQYEQYKQQTGLPVGALANTFALNQPAISPFGFSPSYSMIPPSDGYFGMNTVEPDFIDFGTVPDQSISGDVDMDFSSNSTFVNPAAIQDGVTPIQPTHPGRVWPGMHQQQAAQAKAQQQALAAQRQRSTSSPSRQASVVGDRENDEVVEESISRLLNRMRNSSVASSAGDDGATPTANGSSHSGRIRKDEEDMDEDERLLASEEGKKLSSKERRQLRNKVSARAFRSRRKEYIGQLEGELAAKAAEADEFKSKNEELISENKRLTDLTRLLLSSPAFSDFLNDLSGTGVAASALQDLNQPRPQPQPQQQQKDANPNQYRSHSTIGMAMIPEEACYESNSGEPTNYGHNNGNMNTGLYDAQVYAITALPDPDFKSFESATLSQKSSETFHFEPKDAPTPIERMPLAISKDAPTPIETYDDFDCVEIDESDPVFALYADQPVPSVTAKVAEVAPEDRMFGAIPLEKALERLELVAINPAHTDEKPNPKDEVSAATLERFNLLCYSIESSAARVERLTAHL